MVSPAAFYGLSVLGSYMQCNVEETLLDVWKPCGIATLHRIQLETKHYTLCLKKVPKYKLSITLSNLN